MVTSHQSTREQQIKTGVLQVVEGIERLRNLVYALELAARSQDSGINTIYWPSIMEALSELMPSTGVLEDDVMKALDQLRGLSAVAAPRAADAMAAPPAPADKTKRRAELAGGSSRE